MNRWIALFLISVISPFLFAQTLAPSSGEADSCMDVVRSFLSSSDYNSPEKVDRIRSSCIEVDTRCVQIVGESLSSHERRDAERFLPLVRRCTGRGKADCYSSILDSVPSFDRGSAAQASELLAKCEAPRP